MRAVAKAAQERSLQAFDAAMSEHGVQLREDPIVHVHLQARRRCSGNKEQTHRNPRHLTWP